MCGICCLWILKQKVALGYKLFLLSQKHSPPSPHQKLKKKNTLPSLLKELLSFSFYRFKRLLKSLFLLSKSLEILNNIKITEKTGLFCVVVDL